MNRRKLPIGIQTFAKIRENQGYYYVDKTDFALRLITSGSHYFLSRPRRFGKSLFLDTLAELFQGNEPLFRGLYCHDRWDWSVTYPVLRLNLGQGLVQSAAELKQLLGEQIHRYQSEFGVSSHTERLSGQFQELIEQAHAHHGQRVVVLVDEYDKPILDHLGEPDLARRKTPLALFPFLFSFFVLSFPLPTPYAWGPVAPCPLFPYTPNYHHHVSPC